MKNAKFVVALFATLVTAVHAKAAEVDLSGNNYFLGNLSGTQYGKINTNPVAVGAFTAYDASYGTLAPDSEITITYNSAQPGMVYSQGSIGQLTIQYTLTSTASPTGTFNTRTGSSSFGGTDVVPSSLPIMVTSNLNGTTGVATIVNKSNTMVSFTSYFEGLTNGLKGITATYNVSEVPLPSSFLLFATAMVGLIGFGSVRKFRG